MLNDALVVNLFIFKGFSSHNETLQIFIVLVPSHYLKIANLNKTLDKTLRVRDRPQPDLRPCFAFLSQPDLRLSDQSESAELDILDRSSKSAIWTFFGHFG